MSLYLASASSGQRFKIYKDFSVKDWNIEGFNPLEGQTMMMEFIPDNSLPSVVEADFWATIEEDVIDRTLTFKVVDREALEYIPYILKLKIHSLDNATFNIQPSPFASALDWYNWSRILRKMKKLEYRRTFVITSEGQYIMKTCCPSLNNIPDAAEAGFYKKLSSLQEKANMEVRPPHQITSHLNKIVADIEENSKEKSSEVIKQEVELLEKNFNVPKSTIVSVELKFENKIIPRRLIFEHQGWFNYSSFKFEFNDSEQKADWNNKVKTQGEFQLGVHGRTFDPLDFFNHLIRLKSEGEFNIFNMIEKLIEIKSEELPTVKTNIQIKFLAPKGIVQEIRVIIEEADEDYNIMEKLLGEENFIEAIPHFEKFHLHEENLAYGYALNGQYEEAINLADKLIRRDLSSVAHMTKGLALVGKHEYSLAYEAYLLGVNACTAEWYPVARDNLLKFIDLKNIELTDQLQKVVDLLSIKKAPLKLKQNCYCGSKKKFKKCHAKVTTN
ncbi:hypothetical protein [Priestia megaterium]|uniref:hypothetical protein n=1 Tax=Priestia megaterium TaxID=1404 RepID=UPI001C550D8F|nr:hypothetical protein [Priestia megaterium]